MAYELEIGFDSATPEDEATAAAVERWRGAVARNDLRPAGEPATTVQHSPGLDSVGQYTVLVRGEVDSSGD